MFNSIFDSSVNGLDITTGLICAAVAVGLGIVIAITHMKTSQTTKGFLVTLATLPLLVMAVMIMINGNLGTSIAILGAFCAKPDYYLSISNLAITITVEEV